MTLPDHGGLRRRRTVRRSGDEGFALVTTVLAMAVLAAFSLVVLQQTITNTAAARKDQDWVAALAAAQAGLDDYVSRLNDTNGGYYVHTTATPDPTNPAMGFTGGQPNWAAVPLAQTTDAPRGFFHYDVDNTTYTGTASSPPNGNLVVESTGRVGERTRTLRATVRRSGFVDYVYFTDLETPDPLTYSTASGVQTALANCSVHYLTPRPAPPTCTDTAFSGDKLTGPVHSNDTMLICDGNQFLDSVTTGSGKVASNGDKYFRVDAKNSSGDPVACGTAGTTTYQRPGDPAPIKKISIPPTNLALKRETSSTASPRGCLFVGPTKITIKGSQLKVLSPWTKAPVPGCPADETPFTVPANGVVYVDVVPAANSGDPNAPSATATCPTGSNGVGFPVTVGGLTETDWRYPCRAGDVFISQEGAHPLDGRLTVSANNNLYVTGNIEYAGGTSGGSFLGLIAEQFVWLWHPIHTSSTGVVTNLVPLNDLKISAAMLSLNHAIALQNHRAGGAMGALTVKGALTQKYRGSVGTTTSTGTPVSGYTKDYQYDQRLRYDAPPRFLNPLISSFTPVRTAEKPPAYR